MKTLRKMLHTYSGHYNYGTLHDFSDELKAGAEEYIKYYIAEIHRYKALIKQYEKEDDEMDVTGFWRRPASAIPKFQEEISACRVKIQWIREFFCLVDTSIKNKHQQPLYGADIYKKRN